MWDSLTRLEWVYLRALPWTCWSSPWCWPPRSPPSCWPHSETQESVKPDELWGRLSPHMVGTIKTRISLNKRRSIKILSRCLLRFISILKGREASKRCHEVDNIVCLLSHFVLSGSMWPVNGSQLSADFYFLNYKNIQQKRHFSIFLRIFCWFFQWK